MSNNKIVECAPECNQNPTDGYRFRAYAVDLLRANRQIYYGLDLPQCGAFNVWFGTDLTELMQDLSAFLEGGDVVDVGSGVLR